MPFVVEQFGKSFREEREWLFERGFVPEDVCQARAFLQGASIYDVFDDTSSI